MTNDEIENKKEEIESIEADIETLEEGNNEEEYEDFLNEVYNSVTICGYEMNQGTILREMDEIAFNEGLNNYNDEKITELKDQLETLKAELKDLEDEEEEENQTETQTQTE